MSLGYGYISSELTNKQSAVLLFIEFNGCTASEHCMHHFTQIHVLDAQLFPSI